MLNFAVGPVMMGQSTLNIGSEQIPYFRTESFSAVMKQNERLFKSFLNAPENARAVFMTGSGTASMEAAVINTLNNSIYSNKLRLRQNIDRCATVAV